MAAVRLQIGCTSTGHDRGGESEEVGDATSGQVDLAHIGMGFWRSKTLLSAVELELFTKLGGDGMTAKQFAEELDLADRAVRDFPDALVVALGIGLVSSQRRRRRGWFPVRCRTQSDPEPYEQPKERS